MDDREESKTIMDNDDDSSRSMLAAIAIASFSLFFQYIYCWYILQKARTHTHTRLIIRTICMHICTMPTVPSHIFFASLYFSLLDTRSCWS